MNLKDKMNSSQAHKPGMESMIVDITMLHPFQNHPFKVEKNLELFELMRSIQKEGILVPLIVRPNPYGDGYEIISGHRRVMASTMAGLKEIPVIVRDLDDVSATVEMVDSNLHRERILPSEKAFAYKMKLEAMKQQGKRNDLTSDQNEPKLENETVTLYQVSVEHGENGRLELDSTEIERVCSLPKGMRSNELLARQAGESVNQIKRYIRLTYLIPKLLEMVDNGKLAMTSAVELSYLGEEEQYELFAVMDLEQSVPSFSQANRMKRMWQQGKLEMDDVYDILTEVKPNQKEQIKIPAERIQKYMPTGLTPVQQAELIEKIIKQWAVSQQEKKTTVRTKTTGGIKPLTAQAGTQGKPVPKEKRRSVLERLEENKRMIAEREKERKNG